MAQETQHKKRGISKFFLALSLIIAIATVNFLLFHRVFSLHHHQQHQLCDTPTTLSFQSDPPSSSSSSFLQEKKQRHLELVHIPKTGGTSIEHVAAEKNISWGFCKFVGPELSLLNSNDAYECPGTYKSASKQGEKSMFREGSFPGLLPDPEMGCSSWHLPPYFFDNLHPDYNPYAHADLFAVVRNPYTRMISEYYYRGKQIRLETNEQLNDPERMNEWLEFRLKERLKLIDHPYPWSEKLYCFPTGGHFIPQRKFTHHGHRQVVTHILRFENLSEEFNELMNMYGLNLTLSKSKRIYETTDKQLGIENCTDRVLELIKEVFREDFETFNYAYEQRT